MLYTDGILRRFGMENAKPVSTPMVQTFWNTISGESDKSVENPKLYEQMMVPCYILLFVPDPIS